MALPNFSDTKKKMSPRFRRASGWLAVGSFSFWYRTGEARGRKRRRRIWCARKYDKMWADAPGPVGSSHPREERTSRKKVSGQGRVPGVIKINFLAFFAVACIFLCIWSILGIFLTGILRQALNPKPPGWKSLSPKDVNYLGQGNQISILLVSH